MQKETMYKANQLYNGFLKFEDIKTILQSNENDIRIDLYNRCDTKKTVRITECHSLDDNNCDVIIKDIILKHFKNALAEIENTLNNKLAALEDEKAYDCKNILD